MPDAAFGVCLRFVFRFPYGLYGMGIFLAAIVLLVVAIMHMGASGDGQYDVQSQKIREQTYYGEPAADGHYTVSRAAEQ
mgnify:CR=1 FL=1